MTLTDWSGLKQINNNEETRIMGTRYTAEYRGGDYGENPLEWCIVDESQGPVGSAFIFDLEKAEAIEMAAKMNKNEEIKNND
ncbi:hypothetical protein N8468_04770 [Planktomarina temperata]|nr:hypothetical protein [Planktomarina temperata]